MGTLVKDKYKPRAARTTDPIGELEMIQVYADKGLVFEVDKDGTMVTVIAQVKWNTTDQKYEWVFTEITA